MQRTEIDYNKVYQTKNYGNFIILNEEPQIDTRMVRIKFLETGSERVVSLGHVMTGELKDLYKRTVYDIGYLGDYNGKDPYHAISYNIWSSMMARCYNTKAQCYIGYGSIGIKVSDEWHCYAKFQNDIKYLYNYKKFTDNPSGYQLDKDYLQQQIPKPNRVYSKETCIFLSNVDNNNLHALENNLLNINNMSSKYIGVTKSRNNANTYEAIIRLQGKKYRIGTFTSEIAAANAYNYYFDTYINYELVHIHNDVPYMSPEEFSKYYSVIHEVIRKI